MTKGGNFFLVHIQNSDARFLPVVQWVVVYQIRLCVMIVFGIVLMEVIKPTAENFIFSIEIYACGT